MGGAPLTRGSRQPGVTPFSPCPKRFSGFSPKKWDLKRAPLFLSPVFYKTPGFSGEPIKKTVSKIDAKSGDVKREVPEPNCAEKVEKVKPGAQNKVCAKGWRPLGEKKPLCPQAIPKEFGGWRIKASPPVKFPLRGERGTPNGSKVKP